MTNFDDLAFILGIGNLENQNDFQPRLNNNIVRTNGFELSDAVFIKNYRLTKDETKQLINELSPYISPQNRSSDLDITTKVSYFKLVSMPIYLVCDFFFRF